MSIFSFIENTSKFKIEEAALCASSKNPTAHPFSRLLTEKELQGNCV